jgi:hypothetical protein
MTLYMSGVCSLLSHWYLTSSLPDPHYVSEVLDNIVVNKGLTICV